MRSTRSTPVSRCAISTTVRPGATSFSVDKKARSVTAFIVLLSNPTFGDSAQGASLTQSALGEQLGLRLSRIGVITADTSVKLLGQSWPERRFAHFEATREAEP